MPNPRLRILLLLVALILPAAPLHLASPPVQLDPPPLDYATAAEEIRGHIRTADGSVTHEWKVTAAKEPWDLPAAPARTGGVILPSSFDLNQGTVPTFQTTLTEQLSEKILKSMSPCDVKAVSGTSSDEDGPPAPRTISTDPNNPTDAVKASTEAMKYATELSQEAAKAEAEYWARRSRFGFEGVPGAHVSYEPRVVEHSNMTAEEIIASISSEEVDDVESPVGSWGKPRAVDEDSLGVWRQVVTECPVHEATGTSFTSLGEPVSVKSQVVAGVNYDFAFSDGTSVTVFSQPWKQTIEVVEVRKRDGVSAPAKVATA
jgi:hypothetical protein